MNMRLFGASLVVTVLTAASAKAGVYDDCDAAIIYGNTVAIEGFADEIRGRNLIRGESMAQAEACVSAAEGTPMVRQGRIWVSVAEEDAARLRAAEKAARLQAEEEAARLQAEEDAARLQAEEDAARLQAEEDAAEQMRARVCELRQLVRQYDRTISGAEAARQDRRIETLSATVQECSSWFNESPKEALTNDMCNSIFAAGGLPNSTISGPSQSELLLAELSKQNVETELKIIIASGMLLEEYMAQYPSEEVDDSYNCSE